MVGGDAVRRGLRFFLGGRVASGVLGVVWLALLVRTLDRDQLGVYYGFLAVFEIAQVLSSFGVYSYAQRYLPAAWVTEPRASFRRLVFQLLGWRSSTLVLVCAILLPLWPTVTSLLDWPSAAPALTVALSFLLLEGLARFIDTIFECTVSQGVSQLLSVVRNALRIGIVFWAVAQGMKPDAGWILGMEAVLAAGYISIALAWVVHLVLRVPADRTAPQVDRSGRLAFALHGYASLALGSFIGGESVRLIVSHLAGPAVLGVLAFAMSLVDVIRRYMPANLLLGFVRAVLTGRAESGDSMVETLSRIRLLTRLNAIFLACASGWFLVFGEEAVRVYTNRSGFAEAVPYIVVFLLMLFVQTFRLMATLLAHVRADNLAVLWATASIVVGPLFAFTAVPVFGAPAAALAFLLQEIAYAAVLMRRMGLTLAGLCGDGRSWLHLALATAVALSLGMAVHLAVPGATGAVTGSAVYLAAFAAVAWRMRPLLPEELSAMRHVLVRRRVATTSAPSHR